MNRREIWAAKHGPIPRGWVVHNLNGNVEDMRLENLAAVPRKADNPGAILAPYRVRIQQLERQLKLQEGENSEH